MTLLHFPEAHTTPDDDPTEIHRGQWRLARIEVVNWGTFDGHHSVDVARQGHLFTGASGSGKSSLLDAIAAVLTPDRWLRLNAAAQEGTSRTGDRSLVSYVRGAWSKEADETENRAVSSYLRRGAVWSGILLRFEDLEHTPVTLIRLFHLRGTSTDSADLRDACLVTRDTSGLLEYATYAATGIDARRMKADLDPVVVSTNRSHAPFYTRVRSLLGIANENALHLLHKTQSAKNLGSLDVLFRTFMLDEPTTFRRAKNAVEQFGELNEAHAHVVDLRRQADSLAAIDEFATEYDTADAEARAADSLRSAVLPYAEQTKARLAEQAVREATADVARTDHAAQSARTARTEAEAALESARLRVAQTGGSDVAHLRARIDEAREREEAIVTRRRQLSERLAAAGVPMPDNAAQLGELQDAARHEVETAAPRAVAHDLTERLFRARDDVRLITTELDALRGRRSNLPADLLFVRKRIAAELKLSEQSLPFAGELIDVADGFEDWAGAIERVLAPLSTALLVRDELLARARRVVDGMHLETRLVLDAIPAASDPPPRTRDDRSLVHRVRVADGPFAAYLQRRLGTEFDYACVDSPDDLDAVERGVTITGLMKRSSRRYEKNDRFRIDDRSRWVLGADNDAKTELLLGRLRAAKSALAIAETEADVAQRARDELVRRRTIFEEVVQLEWSQLDIHAARALVDARSRELQLLTAPDTDLQQALDEEESARLACEQRRADAAEAESEAAGAVRYLKDLERLLAELRAQPAVELDEETIGELDARFRALQRAIRVENIDSVASRVTSALSEQARGASARAQAAESRFVAAASTFHATWAAASANLTVSIADRGGYRALLEQIRTRGLPEHEGNFRRLLRERSRDTLIHLRDELLSAPRQVQQRVDPVNESLGRSPFDHGRYLDIVVKTSRSGEVEEFLATLRTIVEGNWADEDNAAAERRFAVLAGIMRRLADSSEAAWQKRVLDTREHVTFQAREKDAAGRVMQVHDSSAGLSGGQRQKLVIFCLAAALRYQLTDRDDAVPRYGTIVLDEAFDKADSQYTRMAMDIFQAFGFHMILATPQKLLQTLEPYIGAITSVSNTTRKASRLANVVIATDQG